MRIGTGKRKRVSAMTVERAMAIAAWRQADPKTRGPHPESPVNEGNGVHSSWRNEPFTLKAMKANAEKRAMAKR
jgi:hypothetical protein